MLKKVLIGLGIASLAGALSYYFYKEYQLVKQWDFSINSVSLENIGTTTSTFLVTFKIINKSSVEATISELNGSVYINGTYMGTVYQSGQMAIPSQGYNLLTLNVQLDTSNVLNTAVDVGAQGVDAPISINIVGTLRIASGFLWATVPIDDTENYTVGSLFQ